MWMQCLVVLGISSYLQTRAAIEKKRKSDLFVIKYFVNIEIRYFIDEWILYEWFI